LKAETGAVFGLGVLLENKRVLTCAHVVADLLNIQREGPHAPEGVVCLDFPLVALGHDLTAHVVQWYPCREKASSEPEDIALLALEGDLPSGCLPVRWRAVPQDEDLLGHPIRAYGFPDLTLGKAGVYARGVVAGRSERRWIQVDPLPGAVAEPFPSPGFSG